MCHTLIILSAVASGSVAGSRDGVLNGVHFVSLFRLSVLFRVICVFVLRLLCMCIKWTFARGMKRKGLSEGSRERNIYYLGRFWKLSSGAMKSL